MKNKPSLVLLLLVVAIACNSKSTPDNQPDFLAKNIDTTVNPADDFFEYAVGNWSKNTPIPEAEASWGIGNLVREEIYTRLRKINEDASTKKSTKGVEQQIGDFWYSGMDTLSIEKEGLSAFCANCMLSRRAEKAFQGEGFSTLIHHSQR